MLAGLFVEPISENTLKTPHIFPAFLPTTRGGVGCDYIYDGEG